MPELTTSKRACRRQAGNVSLPEVHRSVVVPVTASFWRKLFAFSGPGFLVAVGYMDPGNWATDLSGGARFGYALLMVVMISNFMAILLQHLCIKLGVATGRDLAQACRDHYSRPTVWALWILCEIAIAACDLAEVVGSAIGLQLLFGIPLVWGCVITALDVLAVLYLQNKGFRYIEALVITLILTIGTCFAIELILSKPSIIGVALGFVPGPRIILNQEMLYVSIGILGATVMPHNLYLHSSIVQTRKFEQTPRGKREAIKFATIDSTVALMFALFINGAILVVLSMQLGFAVWPLMRFTGEKAKMGEFANGLVVKIFGWMTAIIIILLNVKLLFDTFMPEPVLKAFYGFLRIPAPTQ